MVLIINFSLDRITKILATTYLQGRESISFLYNTVVLRYVENTGAFLSAGSEWPVFLKYIALILVPVLFCIYGVYYTVFKLNDRKLVIVFASILGGAFGNLVDRLINDFSVVDFLNFGLGSLRTGILNVADMSVTFGVIYLIIYQLMEAKKKETKTEPEV
jgi:signal peptidase II